MCGGVSGAILTAGGGKLPDNALSRYLEPLTAIAERVRKENPGLEGGALQNKIEEENVKAQVKNIVESEVIQNNWSGKPSAFDPKLKNKVAVHG